MNYSKETIQKTVNMMAILGYYDEHNEDFLRRIINDPTPKVKQPVLLKRICSAILIQRGLEP